MGLALAGSGHTNNRFISLLALEHIQFSDSIYLIVVVHTRQVSPALITSDLYQPL